MVVYIYYCFLFLCGNIKHIVFMWRLVAFLFFCILQNESLRLLLHFLKMIDDLTPEGEDPRWPQVCILPYLQSIRGEISAYRIRGSGVLYRGGGQYAGGC